MAPQQQIPTQPQNGQQQQYQQSFAAQPPSLWPQETISTMMPGQAPYFQGHYPSTNQWGVQAQLQPHSGQQYYPPNPMMPQNDQWAVPLELRPWVIIAWVGEMGTSRPVYGPPGSNVDYGGNNIYILHPGGRKEYVTPFRNMSGNVMKPPSQNDGCCGLCGVFEYEEMQWQSTRFTAENCPPELRARYWG